MGKRREARELALMCLHQWDVRGADDGVDLAGQLIREASADEEVKEFARSLLDTYWDNRMLIDETIAAAASNWKFDRIAVVDRCVLRLAVAELEGCPDIPPRVTLDEAIEVAKKFSTANSGSFVNGILDRILTERETEHGA
ncbi:MAG: transcription antitermination factor NusB [Planctomycetota bacterium]